MINTAQNLKEYKKRLKKALGNEFLRSAMGTFATAYREAQGRLFAGVDVPALTREIAAGKNASLPHLEELYETFKARAEAAGVKVHLARDRLGGQRDHCRLSPGIMASKKSSNPSP